VGDLSPRIRKYFKGKSPIPRHSWRGFFITKLWGNNPDPTTKIYVDAYQFMTGDVLGYIAFFKNKNSDWVIKSFHFSNERGGIMENAMKIAQAKGILNEY
jgi:hypothetical protein